jgi:hypothetical protein
MYRYILSTLVTGLIVFYGLVTILFVSPDNYININLQNYSLGFSTFFYQRWGFFAPPPKSNDRLYYIFTEKLNPIKRRIFEVIKPIVTEKSANAPFNSREDVIDYILSNSIIGIEEENNSVSEFLDYKVKKKEIDTITKLKILKKNLENSNSYKTIMKYSKYVALSNNLVFEDYNISFKITKIDIQKFSERNKKIINKEYLTFDSSSYK